MCLYDTRRHGLVDRAFFCVVCVLRLCGLCVMIGCEEGGLSGWVRE